MAKLSIKDIVFRALAIFYLFSSVQAQDKHVVCYYTNWSQYRNGIGQFFPRNINASLCTHLVYSFADIGGNGIIQREGQPLYEEFIATKQRNPNLKTLLAIGGWSAGVSNFQRVASSPTNTAEFVQNAIRYVRDVGFDGLDLDWEYPAYQPRGGLPRDTVDFTNLIKALYEGFQNESRSANQERLLLSAAIYVFPTGLYELQKIGNYLDMVNIMTYDIEGSWNTVIGMNAPLDAVRDSVYQFTLGGVPRTKLVLGLAFYGRSFRLTNPSLTAPGSPASGGGTAGRYTQESGFLAYYEICENIRSRGWTRRFWERTSTPYAYSGSEYVGYDDLESLAYKVELVMSENLGGVMIWAVELDDFRNVCGDGEWTLLNGVNQMLSGTFVLPNTTAPPSRPTTTLPPELVNFDYTTFCQTHIDRNYRDRLNCRQFFTCLNGRNAGIQPCPAGLAFNENTGQCDYIYNVPECATVEPETTKTTTTTTSSTTTQTTPTTTTSTTTQTTPTTTTSTTTQTTPTTTTSTTTQTTPTTTPTTTTSTTTQSTTMQTTTSNSNNVRSVENFCVMRSAGLHIYDSDCTKFVSCSIGATSGVLMSCPAGTAFNGQFCDWESNVPRCRNTQTDPCQSTGLRLVPNPTDCRSFYLCFSGISYPFTCPATLVFNPNGYCDYPQNVICP